MITKGRRIKFEVELDMLLAELPDRINVTRGLIELLEERGQRRDRNVFVLEKGVTYRLIGYTWNHRRILERIESEDDE